MKLRTREESSCDRPLRLCKLERAIAVCVKLNQYSSPYSSLTGVAVNHPCRQPYDNQLRGFGNRASPPLSSSFINHIDWTS